MVLKKLILPLINRWRRESGYRQVLLVAIPLVLSTGSWSIQHFVDRMFLTWYSTEAVAASMPAGMLNFAIMSFFLGTAGYVNTFIAQYYGARRYERIGPAIWQGIYVALAGGVVLLALVPPAGAIFSFVGHDPEVQKLEVVYFRVLCLGAAPAIAATAMAGFFSGRGRAWPVMWVNVLATGANLVMDYALIFGHWGFPELGMRGAAIATVISQCFAFLAYLALLARQTHRRRYRTLGGWRLERPLFARLMRFGSPNGAQFFVDMAAFTAFILMMGRLGTTSLAATNIALNISTLAFMPMIGLGIAISVLVGQNLGRDRPDLAERAVYSGAHLTFLYMASVSALYVFAPGIFLAPFAAQADPESFASIRAIAVVVLRFVALFSLFDTLSIVFAAGIKGAGDTRYVMFMLVLVSLFVLVIPSYVALVLLHANIYVGWSIASAYIIVLGLAFLFRFLGGKWKSMRVIEKAPSPVSQPLPERPTVSLGS